MTTIETTTAAPRHASRWLLGISLAAGLTVGLQVPEAAARVCLKFLAECCKASTETCNCVRTRGCIKSCSEISQCSNQAPASLEAAAFHATGTVNETGKRIAVGGPLDCSADAPLRSLRVTIEQNGFVADAKVKGGRCLEVGGEWHAEVRSRGGGIFGVGPAFACAVATIGEKGGLQDTEQWCGQIDIVAE